MARLARFSPLLALLLALPWWLTMRAAAWDRIRTATNVEPYAFAVYNQLIWNFADSGRWFQTIHFGYDDHWVWSGHRSLLIWVAGWVYRLQPEPLTLASFQLGLVALGAVPAWGLARQALGSASAGPFGALLYLCFPPLMVVALNDYQDLILGLPFALAVVWAARAGSIAGFTVAGLGMASAREEWALMLPVVAFLAGGPLRRRLGWVAGGVGVASLWAAVAWWLSRDFRGHDNPMVSHMGGLAGGHFFTREWSDWDRFYRHFLAPFGWFGLLAPLSMLPAAASLFFHLTAPADGGVDTTFTGHIHHMAPICAWVTIATIDGFGVLASLAFPASPAAWWRRPFGEARTPWWAGAVLALLVSGVAWRSYPSWMETARVVPAFSTELSSEPANPEQALLDAIPAAASVATDTRLSLLVSSRRLAYTYDESLTEKSGWKDFSPVEWALVARRHPQWMQVARDQVAAEADAEIVADSASYVLFHFPAHKATEGRRAPPPNPEMRPLEGGPGDAGGPRDPDSFAAPTPEAAAPG